MNDITSKFTNHLKNVLTRALCYVIETKDETIRPIHLLWALTTQDGCVAAEVLMKAGVEKTFFSDFQTTTKMEETPHIKTQSFIPILSEESKNGIEKAVLTANTYEHRYVGTEHLLYGLLETYPEEISAFFTNHSVDKKKLERSLRAVFTTTASFPEIQEKQKQNADLLEELDKSAKDEEQEDEEETRTPALDYFTEELTDPELLKNIHPAIGRDAEISRVIKILSRRQKNNPILVGEPGVGKTAIAEGLAKRIIEGTVPDVLSNKRLLRLDLAGMIAGTMYRGEFESRLKQLIEEIRENPDVVLFIDEVHTLMGAGAASGSLDAANILKPALARGEIRAIGATTPAEYKKHIETDGALERRFQRVFVKEPDTMETRAILKGVRSYFEDFHAVKYNPDAIDLAVELAEKYLHGKHFPDKAIDILDEAGAAANVKRAPSKLRQDLRQLQDRLAEVSKQKRDAVREEHFVNAMQLKAEEEQLRDKIEALKQKDKKKSKVTVNTSLIREVVSEMTGVPLSKLSAEEHHALVKLSEKLKQRVVGQDDVIERVAGAIRRAKLGIADPNKPLASFLFLGPSGVGKTELAKALAANVFDRQEAFLRLDMSEYAEPHTISKLIGSPAGYVGYREATKLTDHVKSHPYSVILFDELEKAHPDVHNLLLQILDDGILTDATGKTINFRNTIIVMTSNVGREHFEQEELGFSEHLATDKNQERELRKRLEDRFKPELLNRITHTCVFRPLTQEILENIARLKLTYVKDRLKVQNIKLSFSQKVPRYLASKTNTKIGARDIQRLIEEEIEHAIANALLSRKAATKHVKITVEGDHELKLTKLKK